MTPTTTSGAARARPAARRRPARPSRPRTPPAAGRAAAPPPTTRTRGAHPPSAARQRTSIRCGRASWSTMTRQFLIPPRLYGRLGAMSCKNRKHHAASGTRVESAVVKSPRPSYIASAPSAPELAHTSIKPTSTTISVRSPASARRTTSAIASPACTSSPQIDNVVSPRWRHAPDLVRRLPNRVAAAA